jgi:hypothetical protein
MRNRKLVTSSYFQTTTDKRTRSDTTKEKPIFAKPFSERRKKRHITLLVEENESKSTEIPELGQDEQLPKKRSKRNDKKESISKTPPDNWKSIWDGISKVISCVVIRFV